MRRPLLAGALILSLALPAFGAGRASIAYVPVECIRGGELPLLQVNVRGEGELRAYFRRINTTDWCSVEGVNEGPLSRVVLPKFEDGDEIEFFFVLIDGRRVVARSPQIFRTRVTSGCETAWARHILRLALSCGQDAEAIPSAVSAGQAVDEELIDDVPPQGSPDTPVPPTE
jgi:hypothetical protein